VSERKQLKKVRRVRRTSTCTSNRRTYMDAT
jgi:hypothetical protein